VQTFKQLLPLPGAPRVLPTGTVRDWPAMKVSRHRRRSLARAVSHARVPEAPDSRLRRFKINIYSPYFEHTLLYPDQPWPRRPAARSRRPKQRSWWPTRASITSPSLPEQEAFGHLHHVLKYDLYQDVAETPHGHVLAPGQPGTLPLIKDWFTQIAEEFPSPFIHIGADETFDLGVGRTMPQVERKGYGPVYVDFLKQIHDELAPLQSPPALLGRHWRRIPTPSPACPRT
jgi:hexosaminidase